MISAGYISDVYEINSLGFKGGIKSGRSYLEGVLDVHREYGPGKPVEVFYNSDEPAQELLANGHQAYMHIYLIVSLLAIGYGVYGWIKN
jgi:hypothetical protein